MLDNLFLCIGAQKAGTSWLFSVLSKDKRFSYCPFVKEIHYFDYLYANSPHLNNWRAHHLIQIIKRRGLEVQPILSGWLNGDREQLLTSNKYKVNQKNILAKRVSHLINEINDDWYCSLLKGGPKTNYSMDITPDYAVIGEQGFNHANKIAKNIKIAFILRDPVERAWSGILQGQKKKVGGVSAFIENAEENIDSIIKECTVGVDVGARCNYLKTIEDLKKANLFDNTLLITYDSISQEPYNLIENIYNFLQLSTPPRNSEVYHAACKEVYKTEGKKEMPKKLRESLVEFYSPMIHELSNYIKIPQNWSR